MQIKVLGFNLDIITIVISMLLGWILGTYYKKLPMFKENYTEAEDRCYKKFNNEITRACKQFKGNAEKTAECNKWAYGKFYPQYMCDKQRW